VSLQVPPFDAFYMRQKEIPTEGNLQAFMLFALLSLRLKNETAVYKNEFGK
jgi:hypothetical protein